jgi:hypothetical protein
MPGNARSSPAALPESARSTAFSLIQPLSRSFIRILAHFCPAIFDFLNKKRIICFFMQFHAHFSARGEHA